MAETKKLNERCFNGNIEVTFNIDDDTLNVYVNGYYLGDIALLNISEHVRGELFDE